MSEIWSSFKELHQKVLFRCASCALIIIVMFVILYYSDLYLCGLFPGNRSAQDRFIIGSKLLKLLSLFAIFLQTLFVCREVYILPRETSTYGYYLLWLLISTLVLGAAMTFLAGELFKYISSIEQLPTSHYNKEHDADYPLIFAVNIGSMLPIFMFLVGNIALMWKCSRSTLSEEQKCLQFDLMVYTYLIDGPSIAGTIIVYVFALYSAHYYRDIMAQLIFINGAISFLVFSNFIASFFASIITGAFLDKDS